MCGALLVAGLAVPASAQIPSEPLALAGGRVTLGGDVSVTASCAHEPRGAACTDDLGFFNYSDYEHSTLRMLRVDLSAEVRATSHLAVLGEMRLENRGAPQPYALYARFRPWVRRPFDIQVGRLPPTFGAFARRTYANDNLLIGYPLGYQYLTSLRADALPRTVDELLSMRGRGWLSSFSIGNRTPNRGLPIVNAFRWDTGVQVHSGSKTIEATGAVTTGSLGNPLVIDDNGGKQVAGRLAVRPWPGLLAGLSAARGPFLDRSATGSLAVPPPNRDFTQAAIGTDVEFSRSYYLVRAEIISSRWTLPLSNLSGTSPSVLPLRSLATSVEGRYKLRPGLFGAARFDHLGFSAVQGSAIAGPWEAPVSRLEVGGGYSLQRNVQLKMSWQHNTREGGRVKRLNVAAAQLLFWF